MNKIIDGKKISDQLHQQLVTRAKNFMINNSRKACLAIIMVGNNPASEIYVSKKIKTATKIGIDTQLHQFNDSISQAEILELIATINHDDKIDSLFVQFPVPKHIDEKKIMMAISPKKDADGLHPYNLGLLQLFVKEGPKPCTPNGCIKLIKSRHDNLIGFDALVIGASNIVGKPMATMLLKEGCTVSIAHSRTKDLKSLSQKSDIVVVAIGQPEFIKGDYFKQGATVIDVGINRVLCDGKKKIVGDVAYAEAYDIVNYISPVPGGVGPMTIGCLMENVLIAAENLVNE